MLLDIVGSLKKITFIQTKGQTSGRGAKEKFDSSFLSTSFPENVFHINFTS